MLLLATAPVARSQSLSCQILSPADGSVVTARPLAANFIRGKVDGGGVAPLVTVRLLRIPSFGGSISEALWNGDFWVDTFQPRPEAEASTILPVTLTNAGGPGGSVDWTYTGLMPQPGSHYDLSLTNGYYRCLATVRDPAGLEKTAVTTFRVEYTLPYLTEAAAAAVTLPDQSPARAEGSVPVSAIATFSALSGPEDLRTFYPRYLRSDNAGHLFAGTDLATRLSSDFGPLSNRLASRPVIQRIGTNGWRRERELKSTFEGGAIQYAVRWSPSDSFTSIPADQAFLGLTLLGMETDPAGNCYAVCLAYQPNWERTFLVESRHIVVIKFSPTGQVL